MCCNLCDVLRWAHWRPGTFTFLGLSARCATQAPSAGPVYLIVKDQDKNK